MYDTRQDKFTHAAITVDDPALRKLSGKWIEVSLGIMSKEYAADDPCEGEGDFSTV